MRRRLPGMAHHWTLALVDKQVQGLAPTRLREEGLRESEGGHQGNARYEGPRPFFSRMLAYFTLLVLDLNLEKSPEIFGIVLCKFFGAEYGSLGTTGYLRTVCKYMRYIPLYRP